MNRLSLSHLSNEVLLRDLAALAAADRGTSAVLIAHIIEADDRRLYAPAACSSMYVYCIRVLRMSEDVACKRMAVARVARRFPFVLDAIVTGDLHVTGVALLERHLKEKVTEELLRAAVGKSRTGLERLIATINPQPELPTRITAIAVAASPELGRVSPVPGQVTLDESQLRVSPVPGRVTLDESQLRVSPVPGRVVLDASVMPPVHRYKLETVLDQEAHDLMARVQELEGLPSGPSGAAEALKRALRARVAELEKRKFATTDKPRPARRSTSKNPRYIPADVRRQVRNRDGGCCTYVSSTGQRCESRRVEFDHIEPVARGGRSTVSNLRLLCRTHNHHAAERAYGAGFMETKRDEAGAAKEARDRAAAEGRAEAEPQGRRCARPRHLGPETFRVRPRSPVRRTGMTG